MFFVFEILLNKWKLVCCHETNLSIAAEFEWKSLNPETLDQAVDMSSIDNTRKDPRLLSQVDIELTLAKRRIPRLRNPEMQEWKMNESLLIDDAFLPKTYGIRLEEGNFLTPSDAMSPKEDKYTPRFALRLAFDKSPYPPRHEWKEPEGAPDAMRMWEWKDFYGRQSAELKRHGDRDTWWGYLVGKLRSL